MQDSESDSRAREVSDWSENKIPCNISNLLPESLSLIRSCVAPVEHQSRNANVQPTLFGGRIDLVCLSHLRWSFVYQRPQHLMSRFAGRQRVFFVEEPIPDAISTSRLEVNRDACGVWIVVPHLVTGLLEVEAADTLRQLLEQLFNDYRISEYLLWYYTPMGLDFSRDLKPLAVIYDCMDELSAFRNAPTQLIEREAELLSRANVVFTGGHSLYEVKRHLHKNVYAFPSGVDVKHFLLARQAQAELMDQADIAQPRIGFAGVIDERMDLELLAGIADARPDWHFVMLGPTAKIDPDHLPKRSNIHWLGFKPYVDLPAYFASWQVAMMPFALNESTRFISPTKTPEYLASGLPVVSTSIHDVVRPYGEQGLVRIADGLEAFISAIETALAPADADWLKRVDAFLEKASWERTWEGMVQRIEAVLTPSPVVPIKRGATRSPLFDYLIVGAGFAGSVLAERLASGSNKKVLIVDRRSHVGGNAYDHYDDAGLLVHRYGPHIFHTNSRKVFEYLSRFTEWRAYEHRVLASVDGQLVPLPINLDTINTLYGLKLTSQELEAFFASVAEPCKRLLTSEDVVVSKIGRELYEKFFRNYTRKQWGLDPSELDASVIARVPVRTNRDCRYFSDTYQAMPLHGYTRLFEKLLHHPNIKVMLNTDYREIKDEISYDQMIYTGPVDEFFDLRYGKLPYRSLSFKHNNFPTSVYQPGAVVNYPNEHLYTRVTEFKYLTGQQHSHTSVVYEFPQSEGDPYYPVPRPENNEIYKKYKVLAESTPNVHFVGRLATYKYYNMDQVVAQALTLYDRMRPALQEVAHANGTPHSIHR
jgi:UDP-galactopyranose mutase